VTVFDNALRTIFRTMNDAAGLAATFRGVEVKGDFRRGWVTVRASRRTRRFSSAGPPTLPASR
jgi:hypothetical protein